MPKYPIRVKFNGSLLEADAPTKGVGWRTSNNRVFNSKEYAEKYQKILDKQNTLEKELKPKMDKLIKEEFKFLHPPEYLGYDCSGDD